MLKIYNYFLTFRNNSLKPPHRDGQQEVTMKLRSLLLGGLLLSMLAVSAALASPQGEAQEQLGKAIQESASMNRTSDVERGAAQEKLGLAIQNAAALSASDLASTKDQERLGRLIRDSAFLRYAQGLLQEEIGKTIVEPLQG
jgi:hypothetical protein